MRTKARRQRVDKLFVLGAGASYAATRPNANYPLGIPPIKQTPLDTHFTRSICNLISVKRPNWVKQSVASIKSAWKDHKDFSRLGLEEAILLQEANMKFVEAIRPRRTRGAGTLEFEEYLEHLARLLTFDLRRCREGRERIYTKFCTTYFSSIDTRNRIITFNYDDVLDNILLRKKFAAQELYFSEIKTDTKYKAKPKSSSLLNSPLLLKLHGSVNWHCPTEDFLHVVDGPESRRAMFSELKDVLEKKYQPGDPPKKISSLIEKYAVDSSVYEIGDIYFSPRGTPAMEAETAPCIIPPIADKPITSIRLFKFLWTRACEYLHECKQLYVCGYSLPPTDKLAASLFKEFRNLDLETITVIDPDPSVMRRWQDLLKRSNVGKAHWIYYSDFRDFVSDKKAA